MRPRELRMEAVRMQQRIRDLEEEQDGRAAKKRFLAQLTPDTKQRAAEQLQISP